MATSSVHFRLTKTRMAAFDQVWLRLPHLKGSIAETIDFMLSVYLDSKQSSNPSSNPTAQPHTEEKETTPVIEDEEEDEWD